jgi:hypothetical protein
MTVQDLFLIDDLEAAGKAQLADWVRTASREDVERERDGLLRILGRWAETSEASDPVRKRDLALSDRLEALGCKTIASQIRDADSHDDIACMVMGWRELLERASESLGGDLLELMKAADEANFDEWQRGGSS